MSPESEVLEFERGGMHEKTRVLGGLKKRFSRGNFICKGWGGGGKWEGEKKGVDSKPGGRREGDHLLFKKKKIR